MDHTRPAPGLIAEKPPQSSAIPCHRIVSTGARMVDRNRIDFQGRLGRIEKTHTHGGGFEAPGTLGMSYYNARRRRIRLPRWPLTLLVTMAMLFLLKAMLHVTIGASVYDDKVAILRGGTDIDRIGAILLQADPVTLLLADRIRWLKG